MVYVSLNRELYCWPIFVGGFAADLDENMSTALTTMQFKMCWLAWCGSSKPFTYKVTSENNQSLDCWILCWNIFVWGFLNVNLNIERASLQTRQHSQVDAAVLQSHVFWNPSTFLKRRKKLYINYINQQLIYIKQWYVETDMNVSQSVTLTLALTPNIPWYSHITYGTVRLSMTNSRQRRSNIYILPSAEI